jgi:glycosyltransferase involved in cell wall biosynthesis
VERGFAVTVYCQHEGAPRMWEDQWRGVRRIHIAERGDGALSTIQFDWKATCHAMREDGVALVLGYETGIFTALHRLVGIPTAVNMDGLEQTRSKYGGAARAWLRLNEWVCCRFAENVIADHPLIAAHLARLGNSAKVRTIPYGASPQRIDREVASALGLAPHSYYLVVARPEPDNSIIEIVEAYSRRKRPEQLVVLGDYGPTSCGYAKRVRAAAGDGVVFPGAIYDKVTVHSLRALSRAYVHGHRVGGTNPSLVEALAASAPVIAHDNGFNRWVARHAARYFEDTDSLAEEFDAFEKLDDLQLHEYRRAASNRFLEAFQWSDILWAYEVLLRTLMGESVVPKFDASARASIGLSRIES